MTSANMNSAISISPLLEADHAAVEHLLDLSFGPDRRQKTSYRLREGNTPVAGLGFAVRDAALGVVGAISYWPLAIGAKGTHALLLGPLAVHPEKQNMGIGMALMRHSLGLAATMGHKLVLLVGDAPYYGRVGFAQVPEGKLLLPGPVDVRRFLYLELVQGALTPAQGLVMPINRYVG